MANEFSIQNNSTPEKQLGSGVNVAKRNAWFFLGLMGNESIFPEFKMRVVVDTKALVFLPIKHPDLFVCADLAWIECYPGQHYMVTSLDNNFLSGLSDLEKMLLYKNTTGEVAQHFASKLVNVLMELANRIPVRDVNSVELSSQAAIVPEQRSERYLYNPGNRFPAIQPALFKHEALKISKAANENEIAATRPPVPASTPTRLPVPNPTPAPRTANVSPQAKPRQANVAGVIWAQADKLWELNGKPKDTKILLGLRRKIMDDLENNHGVKRSTSSNELGNWMKTKL